MSEKQREAATGGKTDGAEGGRDEVGGAEMGDVTLLLGRWREGDDQAFDLLLPLVYGQLRQMAQRYLARERSDHTLQATALVHEAYLRLQKVAHLDTKDRSHFLAVASRAMRRILVDHARAQMAEKRVGAGRKLPLEEEIVGSHSKPAEIIRVHEALPDLEKEHERAAQLVELRFFGGLSETEAAETLGLSRATASRDWRFARLWLHNYLSGPAGGLAAQGGA